MIKSHKRYIDPTEVLNSVVDDTGIDCFDNLLILQAKLSQLEIREILQNIISTFYRELRTRSSTKINFLSQ